MNPDIQKKFEQVSNAITTHGEKLATYPGVLAVRADFAARGEELTAEPAIVVLVHRKLPAIAVPEGEALPKEIAGVLVDVQQASVMEQVELLRGKPKDKSALEFLAEKAKGTGVIDPRSPVQREKAAAAIEAERVDYPRPEFNLEPVNEVMTVTLHSSPDSGWKQLKGFLQGPVGHLSATIFEFGANYIKDALIGACGDNGTMHFVMQYKADANVWDNKDAADELKQGLGNRLKFAWAPVVMTKATTEGWFPSAYHEKVIVKDHRHLWLSSGNWKSSNQPEEDPFNPPAGFDEAAFLRDHNREYHVIADCAPLAKQFELFIKHDLDTSLPVQNPDVQPEAEQPDVLIPAREAELEAEPDWKEPLTIPNERLRVTPLLSPDNFIEQVTALVTAATRRLYIINQYVKPTDDARWRELNEFVRDFSNREGVDFKLIIRDLNYQDSISKMREFGFDLSNVRILKNCHTKGIIVDDKAVVVGSHNWSGQGFLENRDASLIFDDPRVISFYEDLFKFDFRRAFRPRRPRPESEPMLTERGTPTPAGMTRVPLADFMAEA